MSKIPRMGTKAAVTYWSVRARDSIQYARYFAGEKYPDIQDMAKAKEWALDAVGAATQLEVAIDQLESVRS